MNEGFAASKSPRILVRACAAALLAGLLAGCVDMAAPPPEGTSAARPSNIARRPGVSPAGAGVAFTGFAGAPQSLTDQFRAYLGREAQGREINVAAADKANYLVRGYLNAYPEGAGTAVAFVFDVFDAKRQRAQRIEDQVEIQATAADPWSLVDQTVLAAVAAKSAEDLADFLTNTPEAVAASEGRPANAHQLADGGQTNVAATAPPAAQPTPASPPRSAGFASLH
jgi:hypothetical protein